MTSPLTLIPVEDDDILPPLSPLWIDSPSEKKFIIKKTIRFKYEEKNNRIRIYPFLNELELKILEIKRNLDSPFISNKFTIACVDNSKYEYWTYIKIN